jgi:hypothetical protein
MLQAWSHFKNWIKSRKILTSLKINERYNNNIDIGVRVMVFNTAFNLISVISLQSVLLVEETGVPGENH